MPTTPTSTAWVGAPQGPAGAAAGAAASGSSAAGILQRAAIGIKRPIGAHQQQRFADRLCNEQAVKWIAVMEGQLLKRQLMGKIKRQELEAALLSPWNRLGGRERHAAAG